MGRRGVVGAAIALLVWVNGAAVAQEPPPDEPAPRSFRDSQLRAALFGHFGFAGGGEPNWAPILVYDVKPTVGGGASLDYAPLTFLAVGLYSRYAAFGFAGEDLRHHAFDFGGMLRPRHRVGPVELYLLGSIGLSRVWHNGDGWSGAPGNPHRPAPGWHWGVAVGVQVDVTERIAPFLEIGMTRRHVETGITLPRSTSDTPNPFTLSYMVTQLTLQIGVAFLP
jgi:hypothetical protein